MSMFTLWLFLCAVIVHQASAGVLYTRWGRNKCRAGTQLVYAGYAASGHYWQTGGGSNYLCMVANPDVGSGNVPGSQGGGSVIYGVEYRTNTGYTNNKPFSFANNAGADLDSSDAVCAVCYNPKASDDIMVPGRQTCPSSDMHLEYSGYLASSMYSQIGQSEYICLDSAPETQPNTQANKAGGLFYPVQVQCGSLPCPPYVHDNEATCAVCTI